MKSVQNMNIKAIFFDSVTIRNEAKIKDFILAVKKYGVKTILLSDDDKQEEMFDQTISRHEYEGISNKIHVPAFHCIAFENDKEGIKKAQAEGIKVITIGNEYATCDTSNIDSIEKIEVLTFLKYGKFKAYEKNEFAFIENEIDSSDIGHMASLFALGNGYLGLRGTYDENDVSFSDESGMYINGIFEKEPLKHPCSFKGYAEHNQFTVNLPDWRIFETFVDGEKACLSNGGMSNHKRILDMQTGKIVRTFDYTFRSGKRISVKSTRIVSMVDSHVAAIKYEVTPVNFEGEIEIVSTIVKEPLINGKKAIYTEGEKVTEGAVSVVSKTYNTGLTANTTIMHITNVDTRMDIRTDSEKITAKLNCKAKASETLQMTKLAIFYSSVDKNITESFVEKYKNYDFDKVEKEQSDFWNKYWEMGDIEISGDEEDQQFTRFSLFHLRQQLPTINEMSIGATGLTGANYSGKVFWDTEMYLMPYYNFTNPDTCKGLLKYRYNILDKARERARLMDGEGALYSWCSIDGEETSVVFEASTAEYHINSDIAYAIWRYYTITNDKDFVYKYCAEILFETAKFYAHRGQFIPERDNRFCLNVVCGPDEYACGVSNNCYTNMMVQFHLMFAVGIFEEMSACNAEELSILINRINISEEEIELWKKIAENMYYYKNENTNVYAQDDSFFYKDAVDMSMIPMNYDMRADLHPLNLWRKQILKQADVVLINFIRGNIFTDEEKKACFDYYEPKTNHGSSLSAAIHSIMANEIGYFEKAYDYFKSTVCMDIYDFKKNTDGGLHIACLGGVWMSIVQGFLGLRLYNDGIKFKVHIPENWNSVKCNLTYKSSVYEVKATKENTVITLLRGEGTEITVNGIKYLINKDNSTIRAHN